MAGSSAGQSAQAEPGGKTAAKFIDLPFPPRDPFLNHGYPLIFLSPSNLAGKINMRVFTCTDHEGVWPVGVASIVVADNEASARAILGGELYKNGLKRDQPFTLQEVDLSKPHAVVLMDGDY